jgi:hypothetical protein
MKTNAPTFESLAVEIEAYAREFQAMPSDDIDGDAFADGLTTFHERAMALYNRYRDSGAAAFRRPRKSFAVLRQTLAKARPQAFNIPTVAQGKHGAPPPQWAIEDACACRVLADMAASLPVLVIPRDTTSLRPVEWCVLKALSGRSAPSIMKLHERADAISKSLNGVEVNGIDWFRQDCLDTMRREGWIEKIGERKGYCITDAGVAALARAQTPPAAVLSTPR